MKIKGILLDVGNTLVRPIGGSYWPGPYFRGIIDAYGVNDIDLSKMEAACDAGMAYLEKHHYVLTEEEERKQLYQYYDIVLKHLGLPEPSYDLLQKLADAAVDKLEMELYPDVMTALEEFSERQLKLCVVSSAWPSLERKLHELGIGEYFDHFVISSQVGCWKPAEPIYAAAIEKTGLPAENLLFIDDVPEYVKKAQEMGMAGAVINRVNINEIPGIPTINNLHEVDELIQYYENSS
jgi:putative hydrolase of the HAD superfamily